MATPLTSKGGCDSSNELGELWHRHMGLLHHGALNILKEIVTGLPQCIVDQHEVCKCCTLGKYVKSSCLGLSYAIYVYVLSMVYFNADVIANLEKILS